MTHIKRQKLISITQLRGYNTQFLLYPQALSCSFSTIFYAISFSDICLMNRKSISKPKFDKISQSMAEMNYFRFRETDGRHIGFPFHVSILTYV